MEVVTEFDNFNGSSDFINKVHYFTANFSFASNFLICRLIKHKIRLENRRLMGYIVQIQDFKGFYFLRNSYGEPRTTCFVIMPNMISQVRFSLFYDCVSTEELAVDVDDRITVP